MDNKPKLHKFYLTSRIDEIGLQEMGFTYISKKFQLFLERNQISHLSPTERWEMVEIGFSNQTKEIYRKLLIYPTKANQKFYWRGQPIKIVRIRKSKEEDLSFAIWDLVNILLSEPLRLKRIRNLSQ